MGICMPLCSSGSCVLVYLDHLPRDFPISVSTTTWLLAENIQTQQKERSGAYLLPLGSSAAYLAYERGPCKPSGW